MEPIDRKFQFLAVNPNKDGAIYTENDGFVVLAKDAIAPELLEDYILKLKQRGASKAQILGVELMLERVKKYQEKYPDKVKIADIHDKEAKVVLASNENQEDH